MSRPTVLVLADPYVFASLIADALRARGTYEVVVPDLRVEDPPEGARFSAAVVTLPAAREIADVIVELPQSFDRPLRIRTGEISIDVPVHIDRPIDDALDALDRIMFGSAHLRSVDPRSPGA